MKRIIIYVCMWLFCIWSLAAGDVLFQSSFDKDIEVRAWMGSRQATLSNISRLNGTKSLKISQWRDEEKDSSWLSPEIKNPGKPLKISFWAADNYYVQKDASYAAVVDVVGYDDDGKAISTGDRVCSIPWDNSQKSDLWGKLMPEGLVWKYYQAVCQPKGKTFRIKFHWPKPMLLGDCYFTDLMVTEATSEEVATAMPETNRFILELSTPVMGNLFYVDDPIRIEVLLYTNDDKDIGELKDAYLHYTITDFERSLLARGEVPFDKAAPVADPTFSKAFPKRKYNRTQSLSLNDNGAKEVGRELFIQMDLVSCGQIVASDTITYGVVNPRTIAPDAYDKSRFSSWYFKEALHYKDSRHDKQSISIKSGVFWNKRYDVSWRNVQPHYPGPMDFGSCNPPLPRDNLLFNIEYERTDEKNIRQFVPPECVIPDPLHPGRVTFMIDPYVEYMMAYIRHNRESIGRVVPAGTERAIDSRTIELHRKAYAAIKKEFPDLPVGMMLYDLPMNPSRDVDIFLENKLYECCDFIVTHVFAPSVDWTEWARLQTAYQRLGRKPPLFISMSFAMVGGSDQVEGARRMHVGHLDAFAHGMEQIYYFNCSNETTILEQPILREQVDIGGSGESGFMYMQRVTRPHVSPAAVFTGNNYYNRWSLGSWGYEYGGHTMMPVLQAMTYYNLVQNFDQSTFRTVFHPSPNTVAYIFDRGDQTIVSIWLEKSLAPEMFAVKGAVSFSLQSLFGSTDRITPVGGTSLIMVDENPQTIVFDKHVRLYDEQTQIMDIQKVSGGLISDPVPRGSKKEGKLTLPSIFSSVWNVITVKGTVGGILLDCKEQPVKMTPDKLSTTEISISVPIEHPVGIYPFTAQLKANNKLVGVFRVPLTVKEPLTLSVTSIPMTFKQDPAIEVSIESLRNNPSKGVVHLRDKFFSENLRSTSRDMPFTVPANGTARVRFPIPRSQVNLSAAYEVTADMKEESGVAVCQAEDVCFCATPRAPGRIMIDADLSDWNLKDQLPIPFPREFTGWGKINEGADDLSGVFYTLWDEQNLYFAAIIKDNSHVTRANDLAIWQDDNVLLGLYPWGLKKGAKMNTGYYRDHMGLCLDGKARIFRVGNVPSGPSSAEGAKLAVKRTTDGYIYEWCYPKECIAPMMLNAGSRFRLSLTVWDTDMLPDGKYSKLGGMQFAGFCTNVDARPEKWREFQLVP